LRALDIFPVNANLSTVALEGSGMLTWALGETSVKEKLAPGAEE
jgi:hypothetical protein